MPDDSLWILDFVDACRRVAEADLVRFSSGNMSCRIDGRRMAVTGRGAWLERMTHEDVALCDLETGAALGSREPSMEASFHAGVYRVRPDLDVVLHFQSPCATALCCAPPDGRAFFILPEIPYYIGEPGRVPYHAPGSRELSEAVVEAMTDHDVVLLANHGQVAGGTDFDDAVQKAGFFELACSILLSGADVAPLPDEGIRVLLERRARARGV